MFRIITALSIAIFAFTSAQANDKWYVGKYQNAACVETTSISPEMKNPSDVTSYFTKSGFRFTYAGVIFFGQIGDYGKKVEMYRAEVPDLVSFTVLMFNDEDICTLFMSHEEYNKRMINGDKS